MKTQATLLAILLSFALTATAGTYKIISIGTDFAQWADVPVFYADATGDVPEAEFDCKEVRLANDNSLLYAYYETVGDINMNTNGFAYQVFFDTDSSAATGFTGTWMSNGYDYLVEGATLFEYTGTGENWSWTNLGLQIWAVSSNLCQIGIARGVLGADAKVFLYFGTNVYDLIPDPESDAATYTFAAQPPPTGYYAQISINGDFSDWADIPDFYIDPPDDNGGKDFDDRVIRVANDRSSLCLYYEVGDTINYFGWPYGMYVDADCDPSTGFNGNWMTNGYDYLIQGATLHQFTGASQSNWAWSAVSSGSFGINSNRVEVSVPYSAFGDTIILFSQMGTNTIDDIPDFETSSKKYAIAPAPPFPSYFADITPDGFTDDWAGIPPLLIDPTGDYEIDWAGTTTSDPPYDITAVYMANNVQDLFVRIDFLADVESPPSEYELYLDTDTNTATGLTWGWWSIGADCRSFYVDWVWQMSPTGVVQQYMGADNSSWTWGWNGTENDFASNRVFCAATNNILELALPREYLDLTSDFALVASICQAKDNLNYPYGNGDAAPYWNASPNYYMFAPIPEPAILFVFIGWLVSLGVLRSSPCSRSKWS